MMDVSVWQQTALQLCKSPIEKREKDKEKKRLNLFLLCFSRLDFEEGFSHMAYDYVTVLLTILMS
jgi:hypothetical protein